MKLAAIDIGTNAIRLQIVRVFEGIDLVSFKKLEYLRFPLRLGQDVFKSGKINKATQLKFKKLMHTFKLILELYEVDDYSAVATSAMREATNGNQIRNEIESEHGINIEIISGEVEARILNKAILPYLSDNYYIHIDVGGGSTELNLFKDRQLIQSKSFNIGSVRKLAPANRKAVFDDIRKWLKKNKLKTKLSATGIGTGGNINKLFSLANHANDRSISLSELKALKAYVHAFNYDERQSILKLNPDRADVIIPASEIYIRVLEEISSDRIMVPKVGLKDGMVYELFERVSNKRIRNIEYIEQF